MELNLSLSKSTREDICQSLFVLLADTYAVYLKTQNFHWNLKGPGFYSMHLLLEKQYEEIAEAIDEIAERIRALGSYVHASFEFFKKNTSIQDEHELVGKEEALSRLVQDHETIIRHARLLCTKADKEADTATADLLTKRLSIHEQYVWMLRSELGK